VSGPHPHPPKICIETDITFDNITNVCQYLIDLALLHNSNLFLFNRFGIIAQF
jgi:hypothetical protein